MKYLFFISLFFIVPLGSGQEQMKRKGCFALESSVLVNQNNKKSLLNTVGVGLTLDFDRIRIGGLMNFVLVEKPDKLFRGAFAPAFEYALGYRFLQRSDVDLHFGCRGGIRTAVFNFDNYTNKGDVYTVPELQSTSYIGPSISITRYYYPRFITSGFLQLNLELNYMFALKVYNSDDRVFDYKIDKDQAIFGDALHLKLQIGWGKDI